MIKILKEYREKELGRQRDNNRDKDMIGREEEGEKRKEKSDRKINWL